MSQLVIHRAFSTVVFTFSRPFAISASVHLDLVYDLANEALIYRSTHSHVGVSRLAEHGDLKIKLPPRAGLDE